MYLLVLLLFAPILFFYFKNKKKYLKWKNLNVPSPEPNFIFGNMKKVATLRSSIIQAYDDIYKKFPDCKYVGIYIMTRPAILVRDPEIVEDILVKNFSNFHDNDLEIRVEDDPIFGDNPFTLKGDIWKKKRTQHLSSLTPAKIKLMFPEIDECGNRMVAYLNKQIEKNGGKVCMESLELGARYTTETVTAVGVNVNSNSFTDATPELRNAGKVIFEPSLLRSIKLFLLFLIPQLANFMTLRMMPTSLVEKYKNLIIGALKYREENSIKRNDFFDHLQEFRGEKMSLIEMTSQLGGLYIDGFGTNSAALNFMIYAVAAHENVQNRLRHEIQEYMEKNYGVLKHENILEMPYLDAVLSEVLRRYPPFPNFTRRCTKSYTLPKASENSSELTVDVGTPVIIPAYSFHNNEKYFPEPDKFDPERFMENKDSIIKYTYLPFGEGPRICLGMRFALFQSKLFMVKLVQNFKLTVDYNRTKLPIQMHPHSVLLAAKDRLWINFEKL